jgi:DNA-binding MarR family transcriptional regulator
VPEEPLKAVARARQPNRIRDRITSLLSRNYARSNGLLQDGFAAGGDGLRSYHYRLLAALEEWGASSQADLARSTGVDRSDVVSVLGELGERGLITRAVDPTNRRRNVVTITLAGREVLRTLDDVVANVQERVLAPLSEAERRQLGRLLHKLMDHEPQPPG